MTVAVTEFKGLDPTRASVDSITDRTGTGAGESGLAVLFPGSVQGLEPRRREGVAGSIEPLVQVAAARRRGMRSNLLEVPAQLVENLGLERRQQLVPDDLFRALGDVRELRRHDDSERPGGSARSSAA